MTTLAKAGIEGQLKYGHVNEQHIQSPNVQEYTKQVAFFAAILSLFFIYVFFGCFVWDRHFSACFWGNST